MSSAAAAVSANGAKALSSIEALNPLVSLCQPPQASSSISENNAGNQPRLVIIASWTDARDIHVAKYLTKYQALYPSAQVMLLKSTMKQIMRPSLIGPSMKIAAAVIRAAFPKRGSSSSFSSASPPLLIHMFSNGGSSNIANLYEQYAASAGPGDDKRLPPHITILDSCPGVYSISHAVAVVSVGLPAFQRWVAAPILYAAAALWSVAIALGLLPDSLSDWGRAHNHDPGNAREVRRTYIYSPSDDLIDYKGVEAHAADAKSQGFSVELVKYEGSAHVAHLRKDEGRYWMAVKKIVEGS